MSCNSTRFLYKLSIIETILQEEDTVEGEAALVRPIPAISHHSIMYAPKCLVLVSRLDYIETFRVRVNHLILFLKWSNCLPSNNV